MWGFDGRGALPGRMVPDPNAQNRADTTSRIEDGEVAASQFVVEATVNIECPLCCGALLCADATLA